MDEKLYLKPNVVIEPLVDKWYAWSHLISSVTAAKNMVGHTNNDARLFCLSTPRLEEAAVLHPDIRLDDFRTDAVSRMKREAQSYLYIKNLLGINRGQEAMFENPFTESPPSYQSLTVPRICSSKPEGPDLKLMFNNVEFTDVSAIDELETNAV